jgi:MarR family transcriptional regulator, organic hydroperoxide resistance regulator
MDSDDDAKQVEARRCSEVLRDLLATFRARFEDDWRETGVTLAQLRLLKAVEQQPEGSAASIARLCHVTPQTLQDMLARAVREGWITRGISERNHRFVTAALTPEGRALLQRGIALKERIEAEVWGETSLPQLRQVRKTLEAGLSRLAGAGEETHKHPSR